MISHFYQRNSRRLILFLLLTFPLVILGAQTVPQNNNVETWMPEHAPSRAAYEAFKAEFGVEEVVLIAFGDRKADDPILEGLCGRIARLPYVRECWSPERMMAQMAELGVSPEVARKRIEGFLISRPDVPPEEQMVGIVAMLSEEGLQHREQTVDAINEILTYCQLDPSQEIIRFAGSPIVVKELDKLGGSDNNLKFFGLTLLISFGLMYMNLRTWKLPAALMLMMLWSIELSEASLHLLGGEKNFILSALSVMVMIFTLAISIHFVHYYISSIDDKDPIGKAFRLAWKPCGLATITTVIGLVSLGLSDFVPVRQFGYASAVGCVIALIVGLIFTPAFLVALNFRGETVKSHDAFFKPAIDRLILHAGKTSAFLVVCVGVLAVGLTWLSSQINPLDFLPRQSQVLEDQYKVDNYLTSDSTIEAVYDLGESEIAFADKLEMVRTVQQSLGRHEAITHTLSLADFFPEQMPSGTFEAMSLLKTAQSRQGENGLTSPGERRWRITLRIDENKGLSESEIIEELQASTQGLNVSFTGLSILVQQAQENIFQGFLESSISAFLVITLVMMISLRSIFTALIAMIPNIMPILIVFGGMGWMDFPIDIGTMMTGSIALGIAVDGTFHFLTRFRSHYQDHPDAPECVRSALHHCAAPIAQAGLIAGIGMLGLSLSPFTPTARFGYLMTLLMLAALIGDLIMLPALLALFGRKKAAPIEPAVVTPPLPLPKPQFLRPFVEKTSRGSRE